MKFQDFKHVKKLYRGELSTSSDSSQLYKYNLDADQSQLWMIKGNKFFWTFREYVASGVYKELLGDSISDIRLVIDSEAKKLPLTNTQMAGHKSVFYRLFYKSGFKAIDPNSPDIEKQEANNLKANSLAVSREQTEGSIMPKNFLFDEEKPQRIKLAVKYNSKLATYGTGFDVSKKAHGVPFNCLLDNCKIVGSKVFKGNALTDTTIDSVPVKNSYDTLLSTVLVHNGDTLYGNNYALLKGEKSYEATRIDFDDSFYFMDADHIPNQYFLILPQMPVFPEITVRKVNFSGLLYTLYNHEAPKGFVINKKNLVDALERATNKNITAVKEAIAQKVEEFSNVATHEEFADAFNLTRVAEITSSPADTSDKDLFIKYFSLRMEQRFEQLKDMYICAKAEYLLKTDGKVMVQDFLEMQLTRPASEVICDSIYDSKTNTPLNTLVGMDVFVTEHTEL